MWKIIQGIVPNLQNEEHRISDRMHPRRGKLCLIPPLINHAPLFVRRFKDTFAVKGPRLFNVIPSELRNFTGTADTFKRKLVLFLKDIPDRPALPNYFQSSSGNSVVEQVTAMRVAGNFQI